MRLLLVFLVFLFLGCQTPTQHNARYGAKKQFISNMVRGVIKSQYFIKSENRWGYKLEVIDMANENLQHFDFTYPKKLYNIGDLIYVIYDKKDKSKVKNLYLITKSYNKKGKKKRVLSSNLKKRTKSQKTPWIKPPTTETIDLN